MSKKRPEHKKILEINGKNFGTCITIENSNFFFRIENCKVFNSGPDVHDAGIKLCNVTNGIINNNICSNNNQTGILLYNKCSNNTFPFCSLNFLKSISLG